MNYYTADWHISHEQLYNKKKGIKSRLDYNNALEGDSQILKALQATCSENDIIHHIGDLTICDDLEYLLNWLKQVPGQIVLYEGNHDQSRIFNFLKRNNYIYSGKDKFIFPGLSAKVKYNKKVYILTHWTLNIGAMDNRYNIHGHIHEKKSNFFKHLNVGIDSPELPSSNMYGQPLKIEEIEILLLKKEKDSLIRKPIIITYSNYLKSNIVLTKKFTNRIWKFKMCDKYGNPYSKEMYAGTKFNYFDWREI